jgi:hypothetical protein
MREGEREKGEGGVICKYFWMSVSVCTIRGGRKTLDTIRYRVTTVSSSSTQQSQVAPPPHQVVFGKRWIINFGRSQADCMVCALE